MFDFLFLHYHTFPSTPTVAGTPYRSLHYTSQSNSKSDNHRYMALLKWMGVVSHLCFFWENNTSFRPLCNPTPVLYPTLKSRHEKQRTQTREANRSALNQTRTAKNGRVERMKEKSTQEPPTLTHIRLRAVFFFLLSNIPCGCIGCSGFAQWLLERVSHVDS